MIILVSYAILRIFMKLINIFNHQFNHIIKKQNEEIYKLNEEKVN